MPGQVRVPCLRLPSCWRAPSHDTSKADVARRCINRLGMTRRGPVAAAVVPCAKMRSALQNLARNSDLRLTRIVALVFARPTRILRDAALLRRVCGSLWDVPVGRPFPDVADHVVETVAVRWKRLNGRCALVAVVLSILVQEICCASIL